MDICADDVVEADPAPEQVMDANPDAPGMEGMGSQYTFQSDEKANSDYEDELETIRREHRDYL